MCSTLYISVGTGCSDCPSSDKSGMVKKLSIFEYGNLIYLETEEENKRLLNASRRQARLEILSVNSNMAPAHMKKSIEMRSESIFIETKIKLRDIEKVDLRIKEKDE